jgi:pilus assembly protein Flp/PilA
LQCNKWKAFKPGRDYPSDLSQERRDRKMKQIMRFLKDEEGATAVEYGIKVALIAAVIVAVVTAVGGKVNTAFQTVNGAM